MPESDSTKLNQTFSAELLISIMLRIGVYTSASILLTGLTLLLLKPSSKVDHQTISTLWAGLMSGDGASIISMGILLLILLPVARVAFTLILFIREKDSIYIAVSGFVFLLLLLSLLSGAET